MSEEITNITENSEASEVITEDKIETEEQLKENEDAYNKALEHLNSYGLNWTFRSIRYVIDKEHIGFAQLRSCVYFEGNRGYFDYLRSVMSLIKAGLVGSKQVPDTDAKALEDRTYDIIEDWRNEVGSLPCLHLLLIHVMETRHFFMDMADMKIVKHLSYKNLQGDLAKTLIEQDIKDKINQAQALAGTV